MSKWKGKRLQLPKEMHSTIMSHLPAYFKQRIKDHIFQTHMLMAEFNVHVQTNEALEAELKGIVDQYDSNNNTSKRSIVGIELDMDGEFVLSVHRNEPADRFNRTPYKTTATHSSAVEKKEPPQKKPPQKTQKKGFMKLHQPSPLPKSSNQRATVNLLMMASAHYSQKMTHPLSPSLL